MLVIIAYDIADPKRLKKVADTCKDYGMRVQYSIFECHLEADKLDDLWKRLGDIIDPTEDSIVAYPIHGRAQKDIRCQGIMISYKPAICYLF